jgi:hypothetical protein
MVLGSTNLEILIMVGFVAAFPSTVPCRCDFPDNDRIRKKWRT